MSHHAIKPGDLVRWNDPDDHLASTMFKVSSIEYLGDDSVRLLGIDGDVLECPIHELVTSSKFTIEQAKYAAMELIQDWDCMELATFLAECYPGERITVESTSRIYDDTTGKVVDAEGEWISFFTMQPKDGQAIWYYGEMIGVWHGVYRFCPDAQSSPHIINCKQVAGSCDRMDAPWWMPYSSTKPAKPVRPYPEDYPRT